MTVNSVRENSVKIPLITISLMWFIYVTSQVTSSFRSQRQPPHLLSVSHTTFRLTAVHDLYYCGTVWSHFTSMTQTRHMSLLKPCLRSHRLDNTHSINYCSLKVMKSTNSCYPGCSWCFSAATHQSHLGHSGQTQRIYLQNKHRRDCY